MTISAYIEALEALRAEHGDLEVFAVDQVCGEDVADAPSVHRVTSPVDSAKAFWKEKAVFVW
jgi:hypothetical protein